MIKSSYFKIQDLVHPDIHKARGERAWELIRQDAIVSLDALWQKFGPFVVNTWNDKTKSAKYGVRKSSGLRPFNDGTGALYSMHKFGGAFDCLFEKITAEEVRKYVLANKDEFPYITAIENNVSWFHFDVRNVTPIMAFNP